MTTRTAAALAAIFAPLNDAIAADAADNAAALVKAQADLASAQAALLTSNAALASAQSNDVADHAQIAALLAQVAALQAQGGGTPPPPQTTGKFFAGVTQSTQFSRTWTDGTNGTVDQLGALKAAGLKVMAITDDWWPQDNNKVTIVPASAPDPKSRVAFKMAQLAIAHGIRVYIRLWPPLGSFGALPAWWSAYGIAWAKGIHTDLGAANAAINFGNEPGWANWHDVFTATYTAAKAIEPGLVVGYTPKLTTLADGTWDWFPDLQAFAPPKDCVVDLHAYTLGGGSLFMSAGKTLPWKVGSDSVPYRTSWKRFGDLCKQRGQAGLIAGELGASASTEASQDKINCIKDLWAAAKDVGVDCLMLWNNRPNTDYATEDANGNLLQWVKDGKVFAMA